MPSPPVVKRDEKKYSAAKERLAKIEEEERREAHAKKVEERAKKDLHGSSDSDKLPSGRDIKGAK